MSNFIEYTRTPNESEAPAPTPAPAPVKAKKKRKWILPVAMLVGGMIIGSASVGSATESKPPVVETKVETQTVTKEVKVNVPVTPKECITSLDLAGTAMITLSKVGNLASDSVQAAFVRDAVKIQSLSAEVKALNKELTDQQPALGAAVAACRASAK